MLKRTNIQYNEILYSGAFDKCLDIVAHMSIMWYNIGFSSVVRNNTAFVISFLRNVTLAVLAGDRSYEIERLSHHRE